MDKRVKKLWLKALRSGKYKQGKEALRRVGTRGPASDKFCCLGVLCELAVKEGVIPSPYSPYTDVGDSYLYDGKSDFLPPKVQKWAGMKNINGIIKDTKNEDLVGISLADLNDRGKRFKTIAKVIEEHGDKL